jgi:hypothetical protein
MADRTPLEVLDAAVETFLRDTDQLNHGAFVTGWALGVATARVQAEDDEVLPMVTGARYTLGPQTSLVQFGGLAKYLEVVSEKAIWNHLSETDADDD